MMPTIELNDGHNRPITLEEAQRALYLDFEGRGPSGSGPDPLPLGLSDFLSREFR